MKDALHRGQVDRIRADLDAFLDAGGDPHTNLQHTCGELLQRMPRCQWAGYYIVDPAEERMLVLGPFAGPPTEHTRIPFGSGICGQAVSAERTFIIDDVTREDNYLSCSPDVRSEIVIPISFNGELVGELDLDSHYPGGFDDNDRVFLEWLALRVAEDVGAVRESLRDGRTDTGK